MTTYRAGDGVKRGFYWNTAAWNIELVSEPAGVLPGEEAERYYRVPAPVLFFLAPLMGAAYVIFLPFIGFVMLFKFAWRQMVSAARRLFKGRPTTARPPAAPTPDTKREKGEERGDVKRAA